jgi:hypothetical protein
MIIVTKEQQRRCLTVGNGNRCHPNGQNQKPPVYAPSPRMDNAYPIGTSELRYAFAASEILRACKRPTSPFS